MQPALEVADILRHHGAAYRAAEADSLSNTQRRVMAAIEACRTAALGGHVERCEDCGETRIAYNSCRNRHCPKCQGLARAQWLADRQAELLPVPYLRAFNRKTLSCSPPPTATSACAALPTQIQLKPRSSTTSASCCPSACVLHNMILDARAKRLTAAPQKCSANFSPNPLIQLQRIPEFAQVRLAALVAAAVANLAADCLIMKA